MIVINTCVSDYVLFCCFFSFYWLCALPHLKMPLYLVGRESETKFRAFIPTILGVHRAQPKGEAGDEVVTDLQHFMGV